MSNWVLAIPVLFALGFVVCCVAIAVIWCRRAS